MSDIITATIVKVITKGYAEVVLWENDAPGDTHCIAENPEKAKRGDIVELKPALPSKAAPAEWLPYLAVPLCFAIGMFLESGRSLSDQLLSGLILALMGFVIGWIATRKSRMRRMMEYKITKIIKKADD